MGEGIAIGGTAIRSFGEGVREAKLRQMEEDQARVGKMMQLYDLNQRKMADALARQIGLARAGKANTPEAMEVDHQLNAATSYQQTLEDSIAKGLAGKEGASQVKGLWNKLRGVIGIAKQTPIPLPEGSGADSVTGKSMSQSGTRELSGSQTSRMMQPQQGFMQAERLPSQGFSLPTSELPTGQAVAPVVPGNINLYNRPHVKNPDGTVSTVRSMGVNVDGKEVLIPTVSEDGRLMGDEEAIAEYRDTGKYLGQFNSSADSTAYGTNLSREYAAGKYDQQPQQAAAPFQWQRYNAQPTDMASIRRESYADLGQAAGRIPEKQMEGFVLEKARAHVDDMMNALSGYVAHVKSTDTEADDTFKYAMKDPYFVKIFNSLQRLMIAPEKVLDSRDVENFMRSHFKDYRTHEELKATHPDTDIKLEVIHALDLKSSVGGDVSKLSKEDQETVKRTEAKAEQYYKQTGDRSVEKLTYDYLTGPKGMNPKQAYDALNLSKYGATPRLIRTVDKVTGEERLEPWRPSMTPPTGDIPGKAIDASRYLKTYDTKDWKALQNTKLLGTTYWDVPLMISEDILAGKGKGFPINKLIEVLNTQVTDPADKEKLKAHIVKRQQEQLAR